MRSVRKNCATHQPASPQEIQTVAPLDDGTVALSMIQALIPLGLKAVEDALQQEVIALAGTRYAHADGHVGIARWGSQAGSIFLADQKLPITVPRVRDVQAKTERFIRASARALQHFHARRHEDREWLVLLLDGKTFAEDQVVIALGVTTTGEKRVLGLVQTATENKRACAAFLRELIERGFTAPKGLLVVLDGAKGLRAAVRDVFGEDVAVQRCQWHKRQNVLSYLTKPQQVLWRRKLNAAYAHGGYADAKRALLRLVQELAVRIGGAQLGGRPRRNADAAPARRAGGAAPEFEHHQSHRKRDGANRSQDPAGGSLADQRSKTALGSRVVTTGGRQVSMRAWLQTSALAAGRIDEQTPEYHRRCMSSDSPALT